MTPEYPQLTCHRHGLQPTGYVVCEHIKTKENVSHFQEATESELGTICCEACYEKLNNHDFVVSTFSTCCLACAQEGGLRVVLQ